MCLSSLCANIISKAYLEIKAKKWVDFNVSPNFRQYIYFVSN